MADQNVSSAERRTVNLKILTPGTDTSSTTLDFNDVPLDVTIHGLKGIIRSRLSGSPSPERLRLIFLGHRCNDDSILRDVLGRNVRHIS
jgi:hypothetical protein